MAKVEVGPIPAEALLQRYAGADGFADCYSTTIPRLVSHEEYVTAFYTTWLFKIERWLLSTFVAKASTDDEAAQVARGSRDSFAAWGVEARAQNQLLMCDFLGNTRSWFMTAAKDSGTRLYFGSAIVPRRDPHTGQRSLGWTFRVLLGFHKLYSRALLSAARSKVLRDAANRRH